MANLKRIQLIALLGIFLAFTVVGLGAWTRLVDAGLGCPDWPGCYGFAIWPMSETEISLANELYPERKFEIEKAVPELNVLLQMKLPPESVFIIITLSLWCIPPM